MIYQRPIFGTLAAVFCILLGLFALYENRSSKLTRLFVFYNFTNALWNLSELVIFIPSHFWGLLYYRVLQFSPCLMTPLFMDFIHNLTGKAEERWAIKIRHVYYGIGIILGILSFTPLIYRDIVYIPFQTTNLIEVGGPLYVLIGMFILSGVTVTLFPLPRQIQTTTGLRKRQLFLAMVACCFAILALCFYFLSFLNYDWPVVYFSAQIMVSFTFSYAIFKHDLLPIKITVRRFILFLGILTLAVLVLIPLSFIFLHQITNQGMGWSSLIPFMLIVGAMGAVVPVVYFLSVRYSSLFQEKNAMELTHELKTPLAAIEGVKELLEFELSRPDGNRQKIEEYIGILENNTKRLDGIVNNMLSFKRVKDQVESADRDDIEFWPFCRELIENLPQLKSRCVLKGEAPLRVQASREGFTQILTNLLANAAKFDPHGPIEIEAHATPQHTLVIVKDQGIGIDPESLSRIFEPFFKLNKGQGNVRGSGLGLAIAKRWVEAHHGKIWAESEGEGKGTKISFTLPTSV